MNLEDIYWMWQKNPRAQDRARAKRKGSYPTKKQQEFSTTPICGDDARAPHASVSMVAEQVLHPAGLHAWQL